MLQLTLLRHAKAEPYTLGKDDHDRTLAERGRQDAPRVVSALVQRNLLPEHVIVSSAHRCQETYGVIKELVPKASSVTLPELYNSHPEDIFTIAMGEAKRTGARSVMVIAHNPGLHILATQMAPIGDPAATEMREKFPTSAAAVFTRTTFMDEWRLSAFVTPRSLREQI